MSPAMRRGPRWRWLRLEKGQMLRESWRTEIIEGGVWREVSMTHLFEMPPTCLLMSVIKLLIFYFF